MSASSGPYKSRLLSFINRQFLHVSTQLDKTVRHVRVSAQWGIQTLLYPLYWLVQSGRTVANQLNQTVTAKALASSPDADRPIEQVLEAAQPLLTTTAAQVARRYQKQRKSVCTNRIQGVATLLETRELVLVVSGNHLLNILSPEQQHKLRQRIIWEVANYWYARRLFTKTGRLPAFRSSAKILAPVRFFLGVMRWVQSSPVAIALNLFGESALVRPHPQSASSNRSQLKIQTPGQPPKCEQPADITTPASATSRIGLLIRAAIDYFFGDRRPRWMLNSPRERLTGTVPATPSLFGCDDLISQPPSQPTAAHRWWNVIPQLNLTQAIKRLKRSPLLQSSLTHSEDPFAIRVLIRSAVDYFFGRQPTALSSSFDQQLSGHSPLLSPTPPQPTTAGWLAWEDLFEETAAVAENPPQLGPSRSRAQFNLNQLRRYLKGHKHLAALSATETDSKPSDSEDTPQTELVQAQHSTPKSSPDWIETSATQIGYIKHPLEKILEWLDRIILWLEELVAGIWHRVRQQG